MTSIDEHECAALWLVAKTAHEAVEYERARCSYTGDHMSAKLSMLAQALQALAGGVQERQEAKS